MSRGLNQRTYPHLPIPNAATTAPGDPLSVQGSGGLYLETFRYQESPFVAHVD